MTWLEFLAASGRLFITLLATAGLIVSLAFAGGVLYGLAEVLVWWVGT